MSAPETPPCLITSYSSKPFQKGGTLIAEDVVDLEEHRRLLADPDGYRAEKCGNCDATCLHAHDFRERCLRGDPEAAAELIRRCICKECEAVWRVLPALLARYLHRRWEVVQSGVESASEDSSQSRKRAPPIPVTTLRRWLSRLRLTATVLVQAMLGSGVDLLRVVGQVGGSCTRGEWVEALVKVGSVEPARKFAQVASWIHRLVPGLRLM